MEDLCDLKLWDSFLKVKYTVKIEWSSLQIKEPYVLQMYQMYEIRFHLIFYRIGIYFRTIGKISNFDSFSRWWKWNPHYCRDLGYLTSAQTKPSLIYYSDDEDLNELRHRNMYEKPPLCSWHSQWRSILVRCFPGLSFGPVLRALIQCSL